MSARQPSREFPPSTLRQSALPADGERGSLCGPRWHDDAIFSTLIGDDGAYAVAPVDRCVWGGHYEPGSLIWRNRWVYRYVWIRDQCYTGSPSPVTDRTRCCTSPFAS